MAAELKEGRVRVFSVQPEQFGLKRGDMSKLAVTSPAESLKTIEAVTGHVGQTHEIRPSLREFEALLEHDRRLTTAR